MKNKHSHAEAFMIMTYAGEKDGRVIRRRVWNSRDGVTPFMFPDPESGIMIEHINYQEDTYNPFYKPKKGDMIWVSHNEETALEEIEKQYQLYLDKVNKYDLMTQEEQNSYDGHIDILKTLVSDKSKFIEKGIYSMLYEHGEPRPHLLIVEND